MSTQITTFVTIDSDDPHKVNVVQMPVFLRHGEKKFHVIDSEGRLYIAERFSDMVKPVRDVGHLIAVLKGALDEDDVRMRLAGSPIMNDETEVVVFGWEKEPEWSPQVVVTPRKESLRG